MTIKQANVVIYGTVRIKVYGAEGETYEEIIENAEEAIDDRVIADLKKVYVDPNSPTAKNLMGEVAYFEMDGSQNHHFLVIENENEENMVEAGFENHPLGYGPKPVNFKGEDISTQALQLLDQFIDWENDGETLEATRDGRMDKWIDQARALVFDEKSKLGKDIVRSIKGALKDSFSGSTSENLDKPPKN